MERGKKRLAKIDIENIDTSLYNVRKWSVSVIPWHTQEPELERTDLICANPECDEIIISGLGPETVGKELSSGKLMIAHCHCGTASAVPCQIVILSGQIVGDMSK